MRWITGIAVVATLGACSPGPTDETGAVIERAKAGIAAMTNDAPSARWSNLYVNPRGNVCGRISWRNQMGGYTGDRAFYWLPVRNDGLIADAHVDPATAQMFEEAGCSSGPDHQRRLDAGNLMSSNTQS